MTAPQPYPKTVRMRLMIADNYLVEIAYLYFTFENWIQINQFVPKEGHISGGNILKVYGNFSYFYDKDYVMYLGKKEVPPADISISSKELIAFKVPEVTAP
jgi:hypothetical protein